MAVLGAICLAKPAEAAEHVRRFPRSRVPAWLLTGIDLVWSARLILEVPLGRFEGLKPLVYVAAPVVFFLIVFFVNELLSARALGGLLVLLPSPMLTAARWHPSELRLVVVVLAYAMAIEGMVLLLSPFVLRKQAAFLLRSDRSCRLTGGLSAALGSVLIILALAVY